MAKDWEYAKMAKRASLAGGPELYDQKKVQEGINIGKKEMIPWIFVAMIGSSLFALSVEMIRKIRRDNKREMQEIIDHIEVNDSEQNTQEQIDRGGEIEYGCLQN